MWLLREISLPYLRRHLTRVALTVIGISVGVAAIVATTTVTDSVFHAFERTIEATAGRCDLHLTNGTLGLPEGFIDRVRGVPGVAAADGLVEGFVQLAGANREMLAVFGLDVLGGEAHHAVLPRSAVEVPDDFVFVSRPDSVALARSFAAARGYDFDARVSVLTPRGRGELVVRGLVDDIGPAALYGGAVALMDLPAAQHLLGKEQRVDRIDVRLDPGAGRERMIGALHAALPGQALIEEREVHGTRARDILFPLRVALTLAGLMAAIVAFFIIYHTVVVSIVQRRREIAVLIALGVERRVVLAWLMMEVPILAVLASALGLGLGLLLADAMLSTFGDVVTAWVRVPLERIAPSRWSLAVGFGMGVIGALAAAAAAAWGAVTGPGAARVYRSETSEDVRRQVVRPLMGALLGGLAVCVLLAAAPRTLPYGSLVTFIGLVVAATMVSFALLCPLVTLMLGRAGAAVGARSRGLGILLAGNALAKNPARPVAVLAAIVVGLSATIANATFIESFKHSWLSWVDRHYASDLIVGGGGAAVSFLTGPPFVDAVVDDIRRLDGVALAQATRIVEVDYEGRAIALQAVDRGTDALPLVRGDWREVADEFWSGAGVLVSEKLAYLTGAREGGTITIPSPDGARRLPILGVYSDYEVGTTASISMSREYYRRVWNDELVNRVRVWASAPSRVERVRAEIHERFGATHGLHAATAREFRDGVGELVESIFGLHSIVVLIAFTVSAIGITNFLLTATLDRRAELRALWGSGVPRGQIASVLITEGTLLGVAGAIVALAGGIVVALILMKHSLPMVNGWRFDYAFPALSVAQICVGAIVLAAAAGIPPAWLSVRRVPGAQPVAE
jgi:putative ABC transport system permease protein